MDGADVRSAVRHYAEDRMMEVLLRYRLGRQGMLHF